MQLLFVVLFSAIILLVNSAPTVDVNLRGKPQDVVVVSRDKEDDLKTAATFFSPSYYGSGWRYGSSGLGYGAGYGYNGYAGTYNNYPAVAYSGISPGWRYPAYNTWG